MAVCQINKNSSMVPLELSLRPSQRREITTTTPLHRMQCADCNMPSQLAGWQPTQHATIIAVATTILKIRTKSQTASGPHQQTGTGPSSLRSTAIRRRRSCKSLRACVSAFPSDGLCPVTSQNRCDLVTGQARERGAGRHQSHVVMQQNFALYGVDVIAVSSMRIVFQSSCISTTCQPRFGASASAATNFPVLFGFAS